jgi:hypothetical protein
MTRDSKNNEEEEIMTLDDELTADLLDDGYNIEKNDVDYSDTEGWFVLNRTLSFFWKPSRIQIIDKSYDSSVTMERYDLIEFLKKSDFLPQHGYKIVKYSEKDDDLKIEIKINGQIVTIKQRQKNVDKK